MPLVGSGQQGRTRVEGRRAIHRVRQVSHIGRTRYSTPRQLVTGTLLGVPTGAGSVTSRCVAWRGRAVAAVSVLIGDTPVRLGLRRVEHCSLGLGLQILCQTQAAIIQAPGAY